MKRLEDRIFIYVENFCLRHSLEKTPTIREVARGLNTGSKKILEAIGDGSGRVWTESYYGAEEDNIDDTFVSVDSEKIDKKFFEIMNIDKQGRNLFRKI
jgi:hypothetical protein